MCSLSTSYVSWHSAAVCRVRYTSCRGHFVRFFFLLYIGLPLCGSLCFYAKASFLTSCMTAVFSHDCSDHPIKYPMVLVAREILEKAHAFCFFFGGLCFWRVVVPGKKSRGDLKTQIVSRGGLYYMSWPGGPRAVGSYRGCVYAWLAVVASGRRVR